MNLASYRPAEVKINQFPKLAYKKSQLFDKLKNKSENIAVVGLGYVGLPLAVHMASTFKVVGFDVNKDKVLQLIQHKDPCEELDASEFVGKDISFTADDKILREAKFYIVAVPTPIDHLKKPNLTPLQSATATIAKYLKKGDCVVFESTVFPGCTEEVCVPILERISRLKLNEDFTVAYSPERINPGDTEHTFTTIKKIVSGSNDDALNLTAKVYESVVTAGIHKAPSIKVAEAAKVVENIQRDVNISLMNELSQIFSVLDVNTKDVLKAAGTKWNFHKYYPGLVGGHCIGVDPYYLISKAKEHKFTPRLLEQARATNESMIGHIAMQLERRLYSKRFRGEKVSVLVKGIAFKENVNDIRNSKTAELCLELIKRGYEVVVQDPLVDADEVKRHYGIDVVKTPVGNFDAIMLAVDHKNFNHLAYYDHLKNGDEETVIFDVKGNKKDQFPENIYMSL
ncbi:nucleotide sugar dehydrogenase [Flavobacteriaceae bacterium S356]|uniref:Nucleotide sugar dehydrogenase n=1 Tax=Asprobacillus argus TaxID=3076534 RepID=A0ABU3LBW8_9FLAO|nr:nucleotide sugar dehydrogenase [Flavobacteriaceae bacterium S356]